MARLTSAKCPHCGAAVRLDPKAEWVTCTYCGTSSFIAKQGSNQPTPAQYPVIRVDARGAGRVGLAVALVVGGVVLVMVVGVVVAVVVAGTAVGAAVGGDAVESLSEGEETVAASKDAGPSLLDSYRIDDNRRPLVGDANGDGVGDVIVVFHANLGNPGGWRYAAFSGKDGELIWVTKPLQNHGQLVLGLTQGWLLRSDRTGQLDGLKLKDGAQAWTTALGDEAKQLCESAEANTVMVFTKDQRKLLVDVRTGAQKPAAADATCKSIPTDEHGGLMGRMRMMRPPSRKIDPNEQRDEWGCGSTRVIGSGGSYVSPDPCPKQLKFNPDSIEKFGVGRIRRYGQSDWILLGVRRPGSRVPMIGLAQGGQVTWSMEVPDGNPMAAAEGSPEMVQVVGQNLVVGYGMKSGNGWHVTAIAAATGQRLWDVAVTTKHDSVEHLVAAPGRIYVAGGDHVKALDPATGKQLFVVGEGGRKQPYPKVPD